MENNELLFIAPKNITRQNILEFIRKFNLFFKYKNIRKENCYVFFNNVEKVDLLGILLTYKFLEYSVKNNCFSRPILDKFPEKFIERIKFYGFENFMTELMSKKVEAKKLYNKLKIEFNDDFFIAPIAIKKDEDYKEQDLISKYLPNIQSYYENEKTSTMIFQIFSEIISNFRAHAVEDTQSIIVVHGNREKIEMVCADNGYGIIETLKYLYKNNSDEKILAKAMIKNVTSKPKTDHMGYGLWLMNEVTKKTNGIFECYSNSSFYRNINGKISCKRGCFWQGTIVYIELPLCNPITISDLETISDSKIKINFI
ncbi:MAG: ATP-binding protein [Bacteroidales bacterium]|nr:ATP-binding protein [Bacteroidales bacterium]